MFDLSLNEIKENWSKDFNDLVLLELSRLDLSCYPERYCEELEFLWAKLLGLSSDLRVVFFSGVQAILPVFFSRVSLTSKNYLRFNPSFYRYSELEKLYQLEPIKLDSDLNVYSHVDVPALVCNPNNPSGDLLDPNVFKKWLKNRQSITFWDAVYLPFSGERDWKNPSSYFEDAVPKSELFIAYSLSKAWGIAGARIGYGVVEKSKVNLWREWMNPFALNHFSIAVLKALTNPLFFNEGLEKTGKVTRVRDELFRDLSRDLEGFSDLKILNSNTNFLSIEFGNKLDALDFVQNLQIIGGYKVKLVSPTRVRFSMPSEVQLKDFREKLLSSYKGLF